jgi:peptide/nickel transport system permease protein
MAAYIIRRLIQSVIILLLVTLLLFFAMRLMPGNPLLMIVTLQQLTTLTPERLAQLRLEYGLNKPLVIQYFNWLSDTVHGNLGNSILFSSPVTNLLKKRIPITFHLGIISFIFAHVIGITLGVISAIRRGTRLDTGLTVLANVGITIPVFWLGIMMVYVFALTWHLLPTMGYTSPFTDFWMSTRQLIMPVICLSTLPLASAARQTRSSVLEIMRQDYIRTAWSKGLKERAVIIRHALKNALIPVITLAGLGISSIIGGSVLVEQVFNVPGMGRLAVTSVMNLDYPVAQAIALIIAVVVVLSNLLVDISYGWLDPRIRYT